MKEAMGIFKKKDKQPEELTNSAGIDINLEKKLIKHRRWLAVGAVCIVIAIIAALICAKIFLNQRTYETYEVTNVIDMGDITKCKFYTFADGELRYSNDGISYIEGSDTIWNQAFEMKQPVVDVCKDYMAIADFEGTTIYIYDKTGQKGEIQSANPIIDVQVANQGVVAVITKNEETNIIEIYDKEGTNIAKGQTVLSGDGCPLAISISEDGTKLAVSYLYLENSLAKTRVVFYNYSEVGKNEAGRIVGGFDYQGSIVAKVEFVTNDIVVAFGDDVVTFYSIEERPSKIDEITIEKEIESIFYSEKYVGIVLKGENALNQHIIDVYDLGGKKVLNTSVEFQYTDIQIKNNSIIMNNSDAMYLLSIDGIQKYNGTIDGGIVKIIPGKLESRMTIITTQRAEEIRLK